MYRASPIRMNPNEPTRFFKGYSVWMLRFKDIPEVLRLYEKNQKLQLGYIDGKKQYEHFWCKNRFIDTGIRYQYMHNDRDGAQTERS